MFLKTWLNNPLLVRPIGIGKAVGLLIGLAGLMLLPAVAPSTASGAVPLGRE